MRANPALRIPYAAKTPNTSEASDAQMSITTFSKSAIYPALVNAASAYAAGTHCRAAFVCNDAILAEIAAALTLFSVYQ